MPTGILLVDDHGVVREGYRRLIERDPGMTVIGEADCAEAAYRCFGELRPDVVVLDMALPGASGFEVLQRMRARDPGARILVSTMFEDAIYIERALDAGACAYVTKASAADVLLTAIQATVRGERYLSPDAAATLAQWQRRGRDALAALSTRELGVLRLLVQGATVEDIAGAMNLSEKTVSNYQTQIRQKLGVRNAAQLVRAAARLGIGAAGPAGAD